MPFKDKEKRRAYIRDWHIRNREKRRRYEKEWKQRTDYFTKHKNKITARGKLNYKIKKGEIKRGNCEVCGKIKAEAHHADYSKPFDVRWFCRVHHAHFEKGLI